MSDEDDKPDKLETMLRSWGAQQALAAPPALERPRRSWAAMAAAAGVVLAVGAAAFFAGTMTRQGQQAPVVASAPTTPTQPAEDPQVAALREELSRAQRKVEMLAARVAAQEELLTSGLDRTGEMAAKDQALREALAKSQELARQLAAVEAQRDDLRTKEERLRQTLVSESVEFRRQLDAATADAASLRGQVELLKGRQVAMMAQFQRAYLSAAGEGLDGLARRQAALRQSRLIERLPALRRAAPAAAGALLDRTEAILTRLSMAPADASSAELIAKMVDRAGVIGGIDELLAGGEGTPELRAWLLEARMILAEVNRA
jgi:hypothetical protein